MFALPDLLAEEGPTFQGVALLVTPGPPGRDQHAVYGPHCQCCFLSPRAESHNPRLATIVLERTGPPRPARPRVPAAQGGARGAPGRRHVKVPAWVAHSPPGSVRPLGPGGQPAPAPIRFHHRDPATRAPLGVDMRGRLRPRFRVVQGATISRCVVPRILPQLLADFDNGLVAAAAFLRRLLRSEATVFGCSGQNAGMATLTQAMGQCFDWSRLTTEPPTAGDIQAFGVLAHGVMPFLRHTTWPSQDAFPEVVQEWPPLPALQVQYVRLLARVRQTRRRSPAMFASWWPVRGYVVEPIICYTSVRRLVARRLWQHGGLAVPPPRLAGAMAARVAAKISLFLGHGLVPESADGLAPGPAPDAFFCSEGAVVQCGFPWQRLHGAGRLRQKTRLAWGYTGGPGGGGHSGPPRLPRPPRICAISHS